MNKETTNLEMLSTRTGFNAAVRYINKTIEVSEDLVQNNLGDLLFERGDENLSGERAAFLLRMLLVEKLQYTAISKNLETVAEDPGSLAKEFEKWKGVDLIAAYHHPDLGLLIANPKVAQELVSFGMLRKRELMVIYAGKGSVPADASCRKAADLALSIFEGKKVKTPPELLKGFFSVKKVKKEKVKVKRPPKAPKQHKAAPIKSTRVAAPVITTAAPAVTGGSARMTPMYSVVVSNELFHNGNVEAWKRIIASYTAKYPALSVFIYYEGERILDINTLFKWGKVKHGSSIQFAVSGNDIKDVAKLQRYFVQAASSRFEAFLHGPVNNVLRLFG